MLRSIPVKDYLCGAKADHQSLPNLTYEFSIPAFYVNTWWGTAVTTSIFVGAAITDWLDGYLARKVLIKIRFSLKAFLSFFLFS